MAKYCYNTAVQLIKTHFFGVLSSAQVLDAPLRAATVERLLALTMHSDMDLP